MIADGGRLGIEARARNGELVDEAASRTAGRSRSGCPGCQAPVALGCPVAAKPEAVVRSENLGVKASPLWSLRHGSRSRSRPADEGAPGPNWSRVKAVLFQKMLLNNATGSRSPGGYWRSCMAGAPALRGIVGLRRQPAECGRSIAEFSDEAVELLLAIVLLMIATLDASSSVIPARVGGEVVDDHVVADVDRLSPASR